MGALPVFVLNGVSSVSQRVRACALGLHLVADFVFLAQLRVLESADHSDQELKPNAL